MASSISVGAPQPYPSPSSSSTSSSKTYYKNDYCNFGICSFNCPQLCFLPPPPPLFFNSDDSSSSSSHISPLMAALIAVLAAAFLLLFYFTVISKFCRNHRRNNNNNNRRNNFLDSETTDPLSSSRVDSLVHDPTRSDAGLDDAFIRQITVFKFKREDKLIDGVECSICLNEFNEDENLRLMPNCEHAFHLPCIDTWLKSHSNCPLCRSTMNPVPPIRSSSGSNTGGVNNSGVVAALRVERSNDAVLVIRELESRVHVVVEANEGQVEERETKLEINSNNNNQNNNNNNLR